MTNSTTNPLRSLPDNIANMLEADICSGLLTEGERLPSERDLGIRFNASRTAIREALANLKSRGIVETKAGSGAYVSSATPNDFYRMQNITLHEKNAMELVMELLVPIEVAATRIAAQRRTEDDLKAIKRALIGMELAILNDQLGDDHDFAFHQAIIDATHNPHFQALCKHLEFGARNLIRQARSNTRRNLTRLMDDVQAEHKAIYDAIKCQNTDQAAEAAEAHLRNAAQRTQIYLDE